jgi:hypothetical protein
VAIREAARTTRQSAQRLLDETAPELQRQVQVAANVESALDEATKELAELRSERAGTRNWAMTMALLAGLGFAAIGGIIAWRVDPKWGIGMIVGGVVAGLLAAAVIRYFEWIALGGAIVAAGGIGLLGYAVYRAVKSGMLAVEFSKAAETFKAAVPAEKLADLKGKMKGLVSGWVQDAYDQLREAGVVGKDEAQ